MDIPVDELEDLFDGIERRRAPEEGKAPGPSGRQDDEALTVESDLFPPRKPVAVVPIDSAALTVVASDFFETRPEEPPEDLSGVFDRPTAPQPAVSARLQEAVAPNKPPKIQAVPARKAPPKHVAPIESPVEQLAAELRRLEAELRDFAADPS